MLGNWQKRRLISGVSSNKVLFFLFIIYLFLFIFYLFTDSDVANCY